MRFDKNKNPAALAAKEPAQGSATAGVAIVERDGGTFLAATDGRALTLVRAQPDDGDDTGHGRIYPVAAFAFVREAERLCLARVNAFAEEATDPWLAGYDDGCPKDDPDCMGGNGDCHDACERPKVRP